MCSGLRVSRQKTRVGGKGGLKDPSPWSGDLVRDSVGAMRQHRYADESKVELCTRAVRAGAGNSLNFVRCVFSVQWAQTLAKTGHACTVDWLVRCDGKGSLEGERCPDS